MSDPLKSRLKQLIVSTLKLEDVDPAAIADDAPLIGSGLSLDSIDALELVVAVEREFGVKIASSEESRAALTSVAHLAAYIRLHAPADRPPGLMAVTRAADSLRVPIEAADCRTPFGDARATSAALRAGRRALALQPVLGLGGGDSVPLALLPGRALDETAPPAWRPCLDGLVAALPEGPWGDARHPVFVTSSNFGVGSLHALMRDHDRGHLDFCTPFALVDGLRRRFGWGGNVAVLSHACVSAHIGLLLASRLLRAGRAERALVFSFDFISPFVTGGFHALKILNPEWPAPYAVRPTGSIGLGDGAAFAVLGRQGAGFSLSGQSVHNEMHHFTANRADGAGFAAGLGPAAAATRGRRVWLKGHGTGTLEAGRLEAEALARLFPSAPLVSWKGGLGHTLGSCGLVELAIALEAMRGGEAPGTVGSAPPCFVDTVAVGPFATSAYDGVVLASNAFGGAHAACLLSHD